METYIVRQPILDKNGKVSAYEILYRADESSLYTQQDVWVANAIEEFLGQLSDERFLGEQQAFLTFTPNLLMRNIPKMFSKDQLIIQVEDNSIIHPLAKKIIYRFKKQGYRIALIGFEFLPRYFGIMDAVDIIKVDFRKNDTTLRNVINVAHNLQKKVVASHLDTPEALELAKELGCDYLQGSYVAEQKKSKVHRFDHMQSNFFQLMVAVTKDEPDIDEITNIISRDVTLAFSLMKLVNSAYFALRNQVKSVQQALVILGIAQLKQWIYLLSFREESDGVQDELIRISFQRANFCMELANLVENLPISGHEAYLMGMFSTLGTLLDVPLEDALNELPISPEVKSALTGGEGLSSDLYQLVLCYERADWNGLIAYAQRLQIPENLLTKVYFECVEYVNQIWKDLQEPVARPEDKENDAEEETPVQ